MFWKFSKKNFFEEFALGFRFLGRQLAKFRPKTKHWQEEKSSSPKWEEEWEEAIAAAPSEKKNERRQ